MAESNEELLRAGECSKRTYCVEPMGHAGPCTGDDADLRHQLQQALDECGRLRSTGTGDCYCDTLGETPCAYCQLQQAQEERDRAKRAGVAASGKLLEAVVAGDELAKEYDAAISRGKEAWKWAMFLRQYDNLTIIKRAEAAETALAEQRAARVKAKVVVGPLVFRFARDGDGKCFTCEASSACAHASTCPWGWLIAALFFDPAEALRAVRAKHRTPPSGEHRSPQSGQEEGGDGNS